MGGQLQQGGVKADGIAATLKHGAFQIVVEHHPRQPAPSAEGALMAAQEIGHLRIEEEAQEDRPRVAQHHDKGHQGALCTADGEFAEVAPVGLCLLARQRLQAQIGLRLRARAVVRDQMAEVILAAAITALAHHGIQTAGGERRILLQRFQDERQIGIDQRGAMGPFGLRQTGL